MKTKDARSFSSETQEEIRRKAVQAVLEGKKHVEGGQNLWGHAAHRRQMDEVVSNTRSSWSQCQAERQTPAQYPEGWQAAQMVRAIEDHCPDQLKLPYYLWTREACTGICRKSAFGIRRSVWTIGRWLAEWGFTPQKPRRRAFEQNPEAVEQWVKRSIRCCTLVQSANMP